MASQLQLRGGTTAEHGSFTGAIRELTVDTTLKALRLHDGVTAGGTLIVSLADIQVLIDALSNSTTASLAAETSTRTAAITNLESLVATANSDRAAQDAATLAAAQSYTDTAVSDMLDGAPALLNTLNELAAAINDDPDFVTTISTNVGVLQTSLTNETAARTSADIAIDVRLAALESDPTTATALTALQADVDQNESDADAALALKATIDDPTFTTKISSPAYYSVGSNHLKFYAGGNDIMFYPQNIETLQITRSGNDCRFTSNGGTGTFKFNQQTNFAGGVKLDGIEITATGTELNYVDGATSNIQTQLNTGISERSAETSARTSADNTLQTNIDTITTEQAAQEARLLQAGLFTGTLYVSNFTGG